MKKEISKLGRIIVILFLAAFMGSLVGADSALAVKISGYVKTGAGTPIEGVELQGLEGNTKTNSNGYYEVYVKEGWSSQPDVVPVLEGTTFNFEPSSRVYRDVRSDMANQDYTDTDDDNDGMPDVWETQYGLNPLVNDAAEDKDGDKYSNLQEYEADTKPNDADSKPVDKEEVNLITNGSFEVGTDPGNFSNLYPGNTDIAGWEIVSGNIDYAGSVWKASDGYRSIDMAGSGAKGSISQSFSTEIGRKYEVLFDMAGNPEGQPTIKKMRVVAGLTSQEFAFDVTGYSLADMGWTEKSFIFTATEEISVLTFIGLIEGYFGATIDNVRVFETDKPDPNDPPVQGRILNPRNAHYYKLIDTPMAWNDAKNYCESLGGYLATITSENEHIFVYNNFQGNENCWLGGTDEEEERNWKWITGEAWEYTGWASGEPNNSCVDTCEENYIEIYLTGGASPGWNDIPGSWPHKSICEWGSTTNFKAGVFTVGTKGIIEIDWLYDGGMYKGELGIFSLKGMENLTPGSSEFIAEAVRRVLSDSTEGHLVLSDPTEAAHFSGLLGGESSDWNKGEYTGVKSFEMEPGDFFATILVPDSTFTALAANPGTSDSNKRPLFSLVSSNPAYGMYLGQIADVNGKGMAYAYEDMNAATSDKDYNDLIVQISGAAIDEVPSLNDMTGSPKRSRARDNSGWFDWRSETELGRVIMEHLDAQAVSPETVWLSADVNFPADITVYSPDEQSFGTKGGHIPGATFGTDIDGYRFVKLPSLENGDYRILLMSASGQSGLLTLRKHQGDDILSESGETVTLEAHGTVKAEISVSDSGNESGVEISTAEQGIRYDFNGDGVIDDADIGVITDIWNTCKGDEKYDPFFDLDNDGCITVKDIMAVAGSR